MTPEPVVLGRITGPFGVQGWVKVFSYTEPREAVLEYRNWLLSDSDEWRQETVAEGKRHGKTIIARLAGCDDRDQAAAFAGADIAVPRDEMPEAEEGCYYWSDLEGLRVVRKDGTDIGKVEYLIETGANDVMVVNGEQERLIPFVMDEVVLGVDLATGVITVDWDWD